MAQIDYAGLLTGISSQNQRPSPFTSPSRDQQLLGFAAKQNEALTGRLGGMFGQQQQDPVELAKTKLVGLDPTNPADQPQFIQLLNIIDPAKAAQFKQQLEAKATSLTKSTNDATTVADALPTQYASLAKAVRNKVPGAIDAALGILGRVPDAPKIEQASLVDVATNKTLGGVELRNGIPYKQGTDTRFTPQELEGKAISKTYVKPSAPLVNIGDDKAAERLDNRLTAQGDQLAITPEDAQSAITLADNNRKVLSKVESGMATGRAPAFLAEQAGLLQGVYQAVGIPAPDYIQQMTMNSSDLTAMQNEAMIPFIEMQGRGWTDADRVNYYKTSAGFTQAWQYNEAVATLKLAGAVNTIELEQFANRRRNLDKLTDATGVSLWADYLKNVPRTHVDSDFQRSPDSLKYDRTRVIEDTADLSRYWAEEKPKGFKLKLDNKVVELSWDDIKASAAGKNGERNQSVRGWLAQRENKGQIVGGIY